MEELDFGQFFSFLKSKIAYIIFAAALFFCISSIYVNKFRVPVYQSYTTILLNKTNETESISSSDISLNSSLATTYSEIIKSKRVLRQTIENLDLDMDYTTLSSMISVSKISDTNIIKITVTDANAKEAPIIANEIADVFSKEIVEIYNIENVSIIDVAEVNNHASSTSIVKIVAASVFAGIVISIGIILLVFVLDKTLKNEEDIERITGLPVIGVVPISSHHGKIKEKQEENDEEVLPIVKQTK